MNKKILLIGVLLFLIPIAYAIVGDIISFIDSSYGSLIFSGRQNQTKYITIPRYVEITNINITLLGIANYSWYYNEYNSSFSDVGVAFNSINISDGNWTTYVDLPVGAYFYVNYSLMGATNAILQEKHDGALTVNYSYLPGCTSSSNLQLSFEVDATNLYIKCYTGVGWYTISTITGGLYNRYYEDAVYLWTNNNSLSSNQPKNITIQVGTFDATNEWNYTYVLNTTINAGLNISSTNAALNQGDCDCTNCSISGDYCIIPIYFTSTDGIINYSNINFTYVVINNLSIAIKDESTNNLILENVSLKFTINSSEFTNYTDTGQFNMIESNTLYLEPRTYLIMASSENYSARIYTVAMSSTPRDSLTIFLSKNTSTTTFTISDKDTTELLSNVLVTQYRIINNSWQAVESRYSDVTGRAQFGYSQDINYKFFMTKGGYNNFIFYLSPVLFSSYDVSLTRSATADIIPDNYYISIAYSPHYFNNNSITNFGFIIGSPTGGLSEYGILLTYPHDSNSSVGYNSIGGQLNVSVNIVDATIMDSVILDYYYIDALSGRRNFTITLPIIFASSPSNNMTFMANKNKTYGLGVFDRILIMVFITLGVAGIAALIGKALMGIVLSLFVMGYLSLIGFIPLWSVLISIFMGLLLLSFKPGYTY